MSHSCLLWPALWHRCESFAAPSVPAVPSVELVLGKEQGPPALQWLCLKEAVSVWLCTELRQDLGLWKECLSNYALSALPRSPHRWWIQNKSQKSHHTEGIVLWIWVCTSKDCVSISCIYVGICELSPHQSSCSKFRKASFFKSTLEQLLSFVDLFLWYLGF